MENHRADLSAPRPRERSGAFPAAGLVLVAGLLLGAAESSSALAQGDRPVAPGSIVRWVAEGLEGCGRDGHRWAPLDGACYFPISLTERGSAEVAILRGGTWRKESLALGEYPYPVQRLTLEDDSKVHLSKQDLARVERENRRIGALWRHPAPRRFSLPLAPPLDELPPGGRFGSQRIINGTPKSAHSGSDYAAPRGASVKAVADGVVKLAEEHFFAGNSVFIDHGDELVSMYFHLDQILVEAGQEVRRGQVIARVGSTGRSTGPHLHLGFRWHGAKVDPALLLGPVSALPEIGSGP